MRDGRYDDYERSVLKWRWRQIKLQQKYADTPPGFGSADRKERVACARRLWMEDVRRYRESHRHDLMVDYRAGPEIFIGREKELSQMESLIRQGKSPILLSGIGGIGKSALVREYVRRHQKEYDHVWFLYYDESLQNLLADDVKAAVSNLQYSMEKYKNRREYFLYKLEIIREIMQEKRVLVVIDNCDVMKDRDMQRVFSLPCDMFITTRIGPEIWKKKNLSVWPIPVEGIKEPSLQRAFIREYCRKDHPDNEEELMDYFCRINGHALLMQLKIEADSDHFVESDDFQKSLFQCYDLKKTERDILTYLSIMPAMGIPVRLFERITKIDRGAVLRLKSHMLVISTRNEAREEEMFSLHPLIAEAARSSFACRSEHWSRLITGMAECLEQTWDGCDSWERSYTENQRLEPYVFAIIRNLPEFMPWLAEAADVLITFLWIQQYFEEAKANSLKLYATVEDYYGIIHQMTGEMALRTAAVYYNAMEYEQADIWYLKALGILKECQPYNHELFMLRAEAYSKVARSFRHQTKYEEALKMIEVAMKHLQIYREKIEFRQEEVWKYQRMLPYFQLSKARILLESGDVENSRKLYDEIKPEIPEKFADTFRVNEFECFEVELLLEMEEYQKAYELARATYERAKKYCGEDFKDTVSCKRLLMRIEMLTGKC